MPLSSQEIKDRLAATQADRPYRAPEERADQMRGLVNLGRSERRAVDTIAAPVPADGEQSISRAPGRMDFGQPSTPSTPSTPRSQADQSPQPKPVPDEDDPFAPGQPLRGITDVAFGPLDWFAHHMASPAMGGLTIGASAALGLVTGRAPIADRYGDYLRQGLAPWDAMDRTREDVGQALDIAANDPSVEGWDKALANVGRLGVTAQDLLNPLYGGFGLGAGARAVGALSKVGKALPLADRVFPEAEAYVRSGGLALTEQAAKWALRTSATALREAANLSDIVRAGAEAAGSVPVKMTLGAIAQGIDLAGRTPIVGGAVSRGASLTNWLLSDAPLTVLRIQRGRVLNDAIDAAQQAMRASGQTWNDLVEQVVEPRVRRPLEELPLWQYVPDGRAKDALREILQTVRADDPTRMAWHNALLTDEESAGQDRVRQALVSILGKSAADMGRSAEAIQKRASVTWHQGTLDAEFMAALPSPESGIGKAAQAVMGLWYAFTLTTPGYVVHVMTDQMVRAVALGVNPFTRVGEKDIGWYSEMFPERARYQRDLASRNPFAGTRERSRTFAPSASEESLGAAARDPGAALGKAGAFSRSVRSAVSAVRDNMEAKFDYTLSKRLLEDERTRLGAGVDGGWASALGTVQSRIRGIVGTDTQLADELTDAVTSGREATLAARRRVADDGRSLAYLAALRSPPDIVQVTPQSIRSAVESGLEDIFARTGGDERAITAHFDRIAHSQSLDRELRQIERENEALAKSMVQSVVQRAEADPAFAAENKDALILAKTALSVSEEAEYTASRAEDAARLREAKDTHVTRRGEQINAVIADHAEAMRQRVFQMTMAQLQRIERMGPTAASQATSEWLGIQNSMRASALTARTRRDKLLDATLAAVREPDPAKRTQLIASMRTALQDEDVRMLGPVERAHVVTNGLLWNNYFDRSEAIWNDHFQRTLGEMDEAARAAVTRSGGDAPRVARAVTATQTVATERPLEQRATRQAAGAERTAMSEEERQALDTIPGESPAAYGRLVKDELLSRALGPTRMQMREAIRTELAAWRERALEVARGGDANAQISQKSKDLVAALTDAADVHAGRSASEARAWQQARQRVRERVRQERAAAFVDYAERTNLDSVMTQVFPFWQFASRNPATWGHILAQNPALAQQAYQKAGTYRAHPDQFYIPVGDTGYRINVLAPLSGWKFMRGPFDQATGQPVQDALGLAASMGFTAGPYAQGALLVADATARAGTGEGIMSQEQYSPVPASGFVRAATAAVGFDEARGVGFGAETSTDIAGLRMDQLAARLAGSSGVTTGWGQMSDQEKAEWRKQAYLRSLLTLASNAVSYQDPGYRSYLDARHAEAKRLGVGDQEAADLSRQGLNPLSSPKVSAAQRQAFYERYPQYRGIPSAKTGPAGDDLRIAQDFYAKAEAFYDQVKAGYSDSRGNKVPGLSELDPAFESGKIDRHQYERMRSLLYDRVTTQVQQAREQALRLSPTAPVSDTARAAFRHKYGQADPEQDPMTIVLDQYRGVALRPDGQGSFDFMSFTRGHTGVLADAAATYGEDFARQVFALAESRKTATERRIDWRASLASAYAASSPQYATGTYAKGLEEIDRQYRILDALHAAKVPSRDPRYGQALSAIRTAKNGMDRSATLADGTAVRGYEGAEWNSLTDGERRDRILSWVMLPDAYLTRYQRSIVGSLTQDNLRLAQRMAIARRASATAPLETN